ncbi:hypothetical protein [Phenylobacterium aquaticum]|uniref:hypothetical protein n=1 Tax=Phenylobacterium aquaticum TaxID=1763816 RepID=UPI001F5D5C17|nr:hypothetical protein [Phenylobacterium aquaticum]MCI3135227.1 hypothetical protein [Phenylobacterium aquaticum]
MEFLIGALLALTVGVFGTHAGFDRERGFYPVILIVIASYYVLFALQGGAPNAWVPEVLVMAGFVVAAMLGFRWSLWLVVAALFAHGALDAVHPHLLPRSGAPAWWPMFCLTYDVAAGGYLAILLIGRRSTPARLGTPT